MYLLALEAIIELSLTSVKWEGVELLLPFCWAIILLDKNRQHKVKAIFLVYFEKQIFIINKFISLIQTVKLIHRDQNAISSLLTIVNN
jgi:hypothetical protein